VLKGAVSLSAKYNDIRDACIHLPTPYVTYKASLISIHYREETNEKEYILSSLLEERKKEDTRQSKRRYKRYAISLVQGRQERNKNSCGRRQRW
jgi:hypothetical protein